MPIPKIIHYCWFGKNEKTELMNKCIESWGKLEGYKVIEWNEENFDINSNQFVKEAYSKKKYAFVSDYVRLKVLRDYGGVYFDTDIEIKKDITEFLQNDFFVGFMYDCVVGTALIGSSKGNVILDDLLTKYEEMTLDDNPNNNLWTYYFINKFPNFKLNNTLQRFDGGITIYPKEYFERPTYNKEIDYAEHYYTSTWKCETGQQKIKKIIKVLLGNVLYRKLTHKLALKKTPFYDKYKEDKI